MKEIKSVWAYLRCSTARQETSIPDQQKAVLPYIEAQGWKLLGTYIDNGKSGSVDPQKREAFHQLMQEVDKGKGDAVVCLDTSRFGRLHNIEANKYKERMLNSDVMLCTLQDGQYDFSESSDRIMSTLKEETNNDYSAKIAEKSVPAKIKRLKEGAACAAGGHPPYGLAKKVTDPSGNVHIIKRTDRFQVPKQWPRPTYILGDADEVEVIRWIYDQVLNKDVSYNSIAVELNEKGVPSATGGKWRDVTIKAILRNPIYCGAAYIGKSEVGKFNRASGKPKYNEPKKQCQTPDLIVWDAFDAVIPKKDWQQVQKNMESRTKNHRKPKATGIQYALTGILYCGGCGRSMQGSTNKQLKAGKQVRYRCSCRPALTPECNGTVKGHEMLPIVIEAVKDKIIDLTMPKYKKFVSQNKKKLKQIETQIEKTKRRLRLVDDDELFIEMQSELKELRKQKAKLEKGTMSVPDGYTQVSDTTRIRTECLTAETGFDAIIRKVFVDKADSLVFIDGGPLDGRPLEVSVFRQALKQMDFKVTVYFKDNGADKKYGRWELDKAACKLDLAGVPMEYAPSNARDSNRTAHPGGRR
jgi:DNA invertase Pin-like site-specific DNA recombinase